MLKDLPKPERKFTADIAYGMLGSGSCLLTDVVKPDGYKFEIPSVVRDGSESTATKNFYKRGCHVTGACVLTAGNHPVSIFFHIHSSQEKDYKPANTIVFHAIM